MERQDYVVYMHYTNDTNELFYIGEGTIKRSLTRHGRNPFWQRIVTKHSGFKIRIVALGLSKKESLRLETKLIVGLRKSGYRLTNLLTSSMSTYMRKMGNAATAARNRANKGPLSPVWGMKRPDLAARNKLKLNKTTAKAIRCVETGTCYSSVTAAARAFGNAKSTAISKYLSGVRKKAYGYTWKLI